jgi:amidase
VTSSKSLRLSASQIGRMALLKVMRENGIDAFVHAENTVPTPKIGGPNVGTASLDGITPFLQIPRIVVPAGFNRIVYEPTFALNAAKTDYVAVLAPDTKQTLLPKPMPIAITFFAGQGDEPVLLKIGSAYESATKYRRPPPDFGPVDGREARRER